MKKNPGLLLLAALLTLCAVLFTTNTWAKDSKTQAEDIWTRDKLTGDWRGLRSDLGKHGIGIDLRLSQFYQDVTSGGANSGNSAKYGVKLDTFVNIDAQKLFGSWPGLYIAAHVETRDGKDVLADAGTAIIPNSSLLYPLPGDYNGTKLTSFMVSQTLFDGKAALVAGKLGALDLLQGLFPDNVVDYGLDGFMSANSIMSILSWGRWLTLSQYGVSGWTIEHDMPSTGFIVAGAENVTATSGSWDDSFGDGVGLMVFHRFVYDIADKMGYVYVGGGGSTKGYPSTDPVDWTPLPGDGVVDSDDDKHPWGIAVYMYQVLWQAQKDDKKRRVQLFVGGSVSDNNPSFSDWDVFASIQSFGLFDSRPKDRIGIAGHYYHYADHYVDLVNDAGINQRDNSWSTEVYYNLEVTPWLHLSPNFQYAQNASDDDDPAVIVGARLVIDL
jgi:porin